MISDERGVIRCSRTPSITNLSYCFMLLTLTDSYVFGGYSSLEGHLNDLYELSLKGDNFRWSRVSLSTTAARQGRYGFGKQVSIPPLQPSGRRHAAVAVMPSSISPQSVVIIGGIRAPSASSIDKGGNRTEESAFVFGDVWRLELAAGRIEWQELDVDSRSSQGLRRLVRSRVGHLNHPESGRITRKL